MWQNDNSPEAPGRLENLKELVVAMEDFENLGGFLEHVALVMEAVAGAGGDMVNLMTLHGAKGLEFDSVFLPGWEEGLFPHQRAMHENGAAGLEEERRLAYVGITRARLRVHVSFAANRRIHGLWQSAIPSRFIDELPVEHVEIASQAGLYGGRSRDPEPRAQERSTLVGGGQSFSRPRTLPKPPRPRTITGKAKRIAEPKLSRFKPGMRIFHDKFGYGTVTNVEGDKLTIDFKHTGEKKVIDSFVKEG